MAYDSERPLARDRRSHYQAAMRCLVALVLLLLVAPAAPAADTAAGAKLYAERCSGCHGDDGKGDGPAAAALVPRPRNFRDGAFWRDRKPEDLKAVVRKGKVGTMMPPFADVLTDAEIDAVVAHLATFAPARPEAR